MADKFNKNVEGNKISSIKIFMCGLCNDGIARTRYGLRKHLGQEHIKRDYFNYNSSAEGMPKSLNKQNWVIIK